MTHSVSLIIPEPLQARILSHLFPGDRDEHGLVVAAGLHYDRGRLRMLARDIFPAQDGLDYVVGKRGHRMLKAEFIRSKLQHCRELGLGYIAVHNHGGRNRVAFSRVDLDSHERGYPALLDLVEGLPVGAAVYAQSAIAGDIWLPDHTRHAFAEVKIIGANIERLYHAPLPISGPFGKSPETYNRQVLMFGEEGQKILPRARVGIIGAGGVGSLLVEYLSRLGVGSLIVIDSDRIAQSNLSRVVGSSVSDINPVERDSVRKIDIARRLATQANSAIEFEGIAGDFAQDLFARRFLECDFLFLAADSMRARLVFNAIVQQYYIPGVQVGTKVITHSDTKSLESAFTVTRWVLPGRNCLWCSGMISSHALATELKSEARIQDEAYGTTVSNPSVITMNAVGAAHATNDFLMSYLSLFKTSVTSQPRRFNHLLRSVVEEIYPQDQNCSECSNTTASRFGLGDRVSLPTIGVGKGVFGNMDPHQTAH